MLFVIKKFGEEKEISGGGSGIRFSRGDVWGNLSFGLDIKGTFQISTWSTFVVLINKI